MPPKSDIKDLLGKLRARQTATIISQDALNTVSSVSTAPLYVPPTAPVAPAAPFPAAPTTIPAFVPGPALITGAPPSKKTGQNAIKFKPTAKLDPNAMPKTRAGLANVPYYSKKDYDSSIRDIFSKMINRERFVNEDVERAFKKFSLEHKEYFASNNIPLNSLDYYFFMVPSYLPLQTTYILKELSNGNYDQPRKKIFTDLLRIKPELQQNFMTSYIGQSDSIINFFRIWSTDPDIKSEIGIFEDDTDIKDERQVAREFIEKKKTKGSDRKILIDFYDNLIVSQELEGEDISGTFYIPVKEALMMGDVTGISVENFVDKILQLKDSILRNVDDIYLQYVYNLSQEELESLVNNSIEDINKHLTGYPRELLEIVYIYKEKNKQRYQDYVPVIPKGVIAPVSKFDVGRTMKRERRERPFIMAKKFMMIEIFSDYKDKDNRLSDYIDSFLELYSKDVSYDDFFKKVGNVVSLLNLSPKFKQDFSEFKFDLEFFKDFAPENVIEFKNVEEREELASKIISLSDKFAQEMIKEYNGESVDKKAKTEVNILVETRDDIISDNQIIYREKDRDGVEKEYKFLISDLLNKFQNNDFINPYTGNQFLISFLSKNFVSYYNRIKMKTYIYLYKDLKNRFENNIFDDPNNNFFFSTEFIQSVLNNNFYSFENMINDLEKSIGWTRGTPLVLPASIVFYTDSKTDEKYVFRIQELVDLFSRESKDNIYINRYTNLPFDQSFVASFRDNYTKTRKIVPKDRTIIPDLWNVITAEVIRLRDIADGKENKEENKEEDKEKNKEEDKKENDDNTTTEEEESTEEVKEESNDDTTEEEESNEESKNDDTVKVSFGMTDNQKENSCHKCHKNLQNNDYKSILYTPNGSKLKVYCNTTCFEDDESWPKKFRK